jgi:hypothetical protein
MTVTVGLGTVTEALVSLSPEPGPQPVAASREGFDMGKEPASGPTLSGTGRPGGDGIGIQWQTNTLVYTFKFVYNMYIRVHFVQYALIIVPIVHEKLS